MKAVIHTRYGTPDVLELAEIEKPAPQAGRGAGEDPCRIDQRLRLAHADGGYLPGAADGRGAEQVRKTRCWGRISPASWRRWARASSSSRLATGIRGHRRQRGGGCAEYAVAPEKLLAPKPANLSFEEAAAVPMAGITALQGLRDVGQIKPGQKVLVQGASGGVGTFAVQIAKALGAEVTAVCSPATWSRRARWAPTM